MSKISATELLETRVDEQALERGAELLEAIRGGIGTSEQLLGRYAMWMQSYWNVEWHHAADIVFIPGRSIAREERVWTTRAIHPRLNFNRDPIIARSLKFSKEEGGTDLMVIDSILAQPPPYTYERAQVVLGNMATRGDQIAVIEPSILNYADPDLLFAGTSR